jgi:hypothetical protein
MTTRERRTVFAAALFLLLATGSRGAQAQTRPPDFNGDGFSDLAVGVPGEDLEGVPAGDAGAVNVIYGTAVGLDAANDQVWTQDSPGVLDQTEAGDQFGAAVAAGDFNGDGFSDLAVGAPFEDTGTVVDAGAVSVLYGSGLVGLTDTGNQLWHQDVGGVPGAGSDGDRFGFSLVAGNFNGDEFDDLAVGIPGDQMKFQGVQVDNAGSVTVFYGTETGLVAGTAQNWNQKILADAPAPDDFFGWSLAAGDFNNDGFDELVIGAPFKDLGKGDAGMVWRLDGSAAGLVTDIPSNQFYLQGKRKFPDLNCPDPTILETCQEFEDHFGWALAAGDFNGDDFEDLVISVPGERYNSPIGGSNNTGQVHVLYGSASGPVRKGSQIWNQDQPDVLDAGEGGDLFGNSLAAADLDGDGFDDLIVGVPGERVAPAPGPMEGGIVQIFLGSASKLTTTGQQLWSQDSPGILDSVEGFDHFGAALSTGDFDGDDRSDLAIGAPQEDLLGGAGSAADAGAVNVLYGFTSGVSDARNQLWSQDVPDVEDDVESGDAFGSALTPP